MADETRPPDNKSYTYGPAEIAKAFEHAGTTAEKCVCARCLKERPLAHRQNNASACTAKCFLCNSDAHLGTFCPQMIGKYGSALGVKWLAESWPEFEHPSSARFVSKKRDAVRSAREQDSPYHGAQGSHGREQFNPRHNSQGSHGREQFNPRHNSQGSHGREQLNPYHAVQGGHSHEQPDLYQDRYNFGPNHNNNGSRDRYYDQAGPGSGGYYSQGYPSYSQNDGYGNFRPPHHQILHPLAYRSGPPQHELPQRGQYGSSHGRPFNDPPNSGYRGDSSDSYRPPVKNTGPPSSRPNEKRGRSSSPQDKPRDIRDRSEYKQRQPVSHDRKPESSQGKYKLAEVADIDPKKNASAYLAQVRQRIMKARTEAQPSTKGDVEASDIEDAEKADLVLQIDTLKAEVAKLGNEKSDLRPDIDAARSQIAQLESHLQLANDLVDRFVKDAADSEAKLIEINRTWAAREQDLLCQNQRVIDYARDQGLTWPPPDAVAGAPEPPQTSSGKTKPPSTAKPAIQEQNSTEDVD
ncbi:hypothetical protein EKO04_010980 [Ascochyta lentis]|uniref:Uncharacterized protein n=1 Tax=Ascochyta lentis TaxID=205686 RepID=A0A8H7MDH3_9PLEO|nr:hypothetical protein EKO04_010980 [Ascochyta lentis]